MKFLKVVFLFALMSMLVMSCEETSTSEEPPTPQPVLGTFSGIVKDIYGSGISGVTVSFRDIVTETNEQGWFTINSLSVLDDNDFETVTFSKDYYSTNIKRVRIFAYNTTHLSNVVLQNYQEIIFDNSLGGNLTLTSNSYSIGEIVVDANTFVNSDGSTYSGNVTINASASLPSNDNYFNVFPGDFTGVNTSGSEVDLVSYGFMTVTALSDSKSELKIADGKTVALKLKKDNQSMVNSVPMWHLDEETGVWQEEGVATYNDATDFFETEVAHFSSWNWDIAVDDEICYLTGRVFDPSGSPVLNAVVYGQGLYGVGYYDVAYTDVNGSYTLRALKNSTITIAASTGTYSSDLITFNVDANCNNNVVEDIIVHAPLFAVTLTWGEEPSDLDSHLLVPDPNNPSVEGYHIYYSDPGNIVEYPNAFLDTDDTSSFGPEVITAFHLYEGTYEYIVHNYSGYPNMNSSQGVVTLNTASVNRVYTAPANNPNSYNYWHVFNLVVDSNGNATIVDVNQYLDLDYKSFDLPAKK